MDESAYRALSDEELVRMARRDDSLAVQTLLVSVHPFIISKARQFGQNDEDRQDFYQDGIIGFLSAIHSFKTDGGAKFKTYACTCVLNRMRNLLKQRARQNSRFTVSLSESNDVEDFNAGPEDLLQAQEEAENIADIITTKLSPYEKQVISIYLKGNSYAEIAAKTGTNAKSVDNAMQRIRRKLS